MFKILKFNNAKISIRIVGHIFFLVYFFLAFIFYKERTIFIDCADFSFDLIQSENFVLPLGRWGSFFTPTIPLLALKCGASLDAFLKIYSLSIALFYYVVYLVVAYSFKNNEKLIALYLLTICLTVRAAFYFSIAELSQGLALCVIVYGLAKQLTKENENKKWLKTAIIIVMVASLYYFHQLLLFAIIFALLAIIINKKAYKNKQLLIAFIFANIWFGVKVALLSSSGYEGKKILDIQTFSEQIPNIFNLPSFEYFFWFLKTEMWYSLPLMLGCLTVLFFRKKVLLAAFFLIYFVLYLILIIISHNKGEAPNMYELYYTVLGFFIAIILDITIGKMDRKIVFYSFLLVLCFSVSRMYFAHEKPSMRIAFLEKLVKKGREYKSRKYIADINSFPWDYTWVTWAVPIETILLSSLESKENTVTCFVSKDPSKLKLNVKNGKVYVPDWLRYKINTKTLESNYFSLPENTAYVLLKKADVAENIKDYDYYLKRIGKDEEWMKEIRKKAKQMNLSIDSVLVLDAQFWANKNGF